MIAVHDKLGSDARFSDDDLRLVEIFGARAAVAVSLSERVARDTVRRVVDAQESERRRLALELHDETGQALTSILLGVRSIRAAQSDEEAERAEADCAKPGRAGAPGRTRARRRAPAGSARRLRSRARRSSGSARPSPSAAASRPSCRPTSTERLSPEVEIDALPGRPGGAHERRQAFRRRARQHRDLEPRGKRGCDDRRRRPRLRQRRGASRCARPASACASGSRSSAGRSRSSRRRDPGRRSPLRSRAGEAMMQGLHPTLGREQRGDLVQGARATKARDPHDMLADEATS